MAVMDSSPAIWEEIERSESYLVASMYEEAATVASSVLRRICHNNVANQGIEGCDLNDMKVSAGMVLVQSLKEIGRTVDILNELRVLFISSAAVPVQVLLTGVCFQISEGSSLGVREFLEEFLSEWHFVEEKYYILIGPGVDASVPQGCEDRKLLGIDEYMDVVEIYAVTLLGTAFKDLDLAIAWVEKAALPEERRQGLLRKLHSLYSVKASNSRGLAGLLANNHEARDSSSKEFDVSERSLEGLKTNMLANGENNTKQAILKLSKRAEPSFLWFHAINLKFGNARLVITNGKILVGCLIFLICYVLRRKQATLKGMIQRQVVSIKKALVDLWRLSFSYQVNPLAAAQPLPTATRGGR